MTTKKYWRINCQTDGVLHEYAFDIPTVCPINPAHHLNSVTLLNENVSASSLVQIIVDKSGNGNYTSIAEAFADGNTNIFVKNGMYIETSDIIIPNLGKLIGETPAGVMVVFMGGASMKIDGSGGINETAGTISVTNGSSTVTGTGTTFTNLSAGNFILIGNNFYQIDSIANDTSLELLVNYNGITRSNDAYIAQAMSVGCVIQNLAITGSSNVAFLCRAGRYCHVHDVIMTKNAQNLHILDCGDCSFGMFATINALSGTGVTIENSTDCHFDYCNVCNNASHGIAILNNCNNISFDACSTSCNQGCGYFIDTNSNHCSITDGNCKQNSAHGIHLNNTVFGNMVNSLSITRNNIGVLMEGDGNTISCCDICDNLKGIECSGNGSGSVKGCVIGNNTGAGIDILGNNSIFEGNRIENNGGTGLYVTGNDNIVSTNRISANTGNGLEIDATSSDTIVTSNNTKGNTGINLVNHAILTTVLANNIIA